MKKQKDKNRSNKLSKISYTRVVFPKTILIRNICIGFLLGSTVVWLCYKSWYAMPIVVPVTYIYLIWCREKELKKKKRTLLYHFNDFVSSLHTAMRSGYSLENGVKKAAAEMRTLYGTNDVLVLELTEMMRQMEYRIPIENLFWDLGERSQVEDIRTFGEVILIAKRTGGNMGKILKDTKDTICGKIDTEKEIETLIASKRFEQRIMSLMPAGIILYLRVAFGGMMDTLYGNPFGVIVMTACLLVYTGALFLGNYLMKIEV